MAAVCGILTQRSPAILHARRCPSSLAMSLLIGAALLGARSAWANPIIIEATSPLGLAMTMVPLSFIGIVAFGVLFAMRRRLPKDDRSRRLFGTLLLSSLAVFGVSVAVVVVGPR